MRPPFFALALLSFSVSQPPLKHSSIRETMIEPAINLHYGEILLQESVPLKIVREAVPSKPFTVVGPRGAILGQQDGSFEAWIFPGNLQQLPHHRRDAELPRSH